jgi:hypothetical protein
VSVQAAGGTASSTNDFRFVLAPGIMSFSPTTASSGASIEILGKEFINVTNVRINSGAMATTLANINVASDTRILATLSGNGQNFQSGVISVETA